ncbi:extensin-like [Vespa velutina]|uniref:extensin-like n=1 Tax=Vespa velutina TaxID=202808 RepID=UPI001FB1C8E8|nr:extensin-like [Vespa velutina]
MSQHPSRPPGGHGPPGASSGRTSTPSGPNTSTPSNMFKPPSVYSPSSSRRPPTPVHHTRPMSPHSYPGVVHSMSPVPIGMPISPGMSPVFGYPPHSYIQCPRPRWPSSLAQGNQSPRPFIPVQVSTAIPIPISITYYVRLIIVNIGNPLGTDIISPVPCAPPEYLIAPYRSGDYEYISVPLDHTPVDEESSGPSTAEIIASQSQNYVDEKLAEYQATIQQLQDLDEETF